MSTIKISQLPILTQLEANTANTVFVGVDIATQTTAKFTATTLAQGLYSNNDLVVGQNPLVFSNTVGQFSGSDPLYTQINLQNFNSNGSADFVITADTGTNANSYIDLGINNSKWNSATYGQTAEYPYDGYLIVQGPGTVGSGNLVIGTTSTNTSLVIVAGGLANSNVIASFNQNSVIINEPSTITANSSLPGLVINQYGSGQALVINDAPNDTTPFTVNWDGNTSIGSLSANGYKLLVVGNVNVTGNVYTNGSFVLSDGSLAASNNYVNANDAFVLSTAIAYANVGLSIAQSAYNNSNASFNTANAGYNVANLAFVVANNAWNTANTANTTANIALSTAQAAYNQANTSNTYVKNNYVANTSTITLNNLVVGGNLYANNVGTSVSFNSVTSNNAVFSQNITVLGTLTCNTAQGNVFFSNITTISSQANIIQWLAQTNPPAQTLGQVWFSANDVSLVEDTDVANDRPLVGKVLYEKVYNGSGATIAANSWVRLAGAVTATAIPYVVLADATNAANSFVSGFIKNSIANGSYGYVYTQGIVNNLNASTYNNGDILFLSTIPGAAQNTAPTGANVVVQLAKVLSNSGTVGKLQVNILPQPSWGKNNGSVLYALNNIVVASNTISINDSTQSVTLAGSIGLNGSITMNNTSFLANSFGVGIIGSTNGAYQPPLADGTMLQITGKDGVNSKLINDAAGNGVYALYNGRSMRGTAQSPSASQAGDILVRFGGTGYGNTGFGGVLSGGAKIDYIALENYTDTSKGTQILLATTPVGSNSLVNVATYTANSVNYYQNTALFVANTIHYNANYNNVTVTQLANKANSVYANGRTGQITTNGANINKGSVVSFTVYNTYITSAKDVVILNVASGASVGYGLTVNSVTPGSFTVCVNNCDGTPSGSNAADTLVINFAIINVT